MPAQSSPLKVFIVYAHEDKDVRDKLLRHLRVQAVKGEIELWSDHEIKPGDVWDNAIRQRLNESELILLLISADFFHSDYIQNVELQEVTNRAAQGGCRLLPIIARDCDWKEHPTIGRLQALPPSGKPVKSKDWNSEDEPYLEIVEGFKLAARELRGGVAASPEITGSAAPSTKSPTGLGLKIGMAVGLVLVLALAIWGLGTVQQKQDKIEPPNEVPKDNHALEDTDWALARQQNTLDAYEQFKIKYPSGKHFEEAESTYKERFREFTSALKSTEAMLKAGQPAKARLFWETARKIAPNHPSIQELSKKL